MYPESEPSEIGESIISKLDSRRKNALGMFNNVIEYFLKFKSIFPFK